MPTVPYPKSTMTSHCLCEATVEEGRKDSRKAVDPAAVGVCGWVGFFGLRLPRASKGLERFDRTLMRDKVQHTPSHVGDYELPNVSLDHKI